MTTALLVDRAVRGFRRFGLLLRWLVSLLPGLITMALLIGGSGLAVVGVDLLFGRGWAFIAGAGPTLAAGFILLRGLTRG